MDASLVADTHHVDADPDLDPPINFGAIRIRLFILMRIQIRLFFLSGSGSSWQRDPPRRYFEPPHLHSERSHSTALHGSILSFDLNLRVLTLMRIRIRRFLL